MIRKATRAIDRRLTLLLSATRNLLRPQPVAPHTLSPQSIEKALVAHYGLNLATGQLRTVVFRVHE
jgi:hypothetical protein